MPISQEYDTIFEKFRGTIPLAFVKVLAFTQSGMNTKKSVQGSAGLFMISDAALSAYDKKYPTKTKRKLTDLADPVLNTQIAIWILNNIVKYFASHYPKSMSENWNSPLYAAIIVHGFNTGYSEPQGIGAALKFFEDKPDKLNMDSLAQVAKEMKLEPRKYDSKAIERAKTAANLYVAELGGKAPVNEPSTIIEKKKKGGLGILMSLPVIGLLGYVFTRKKR